MPKMKKKKALTKRVKVTATGKVLRSQANRSHHAQFNTTKQKRQARKSTLMDPSDVKRFKGMY